MKNMHSYVIGLQDIDKTSHMIVGGKGASLGELCQVKGVKVPGGFCISTEAYKQVTRQIPIMNELLDALSLLKIEEIDKINTLCDEIRRVIEAAAMPGNIIKDIAGYLTITGENKAYAIRSSATAEDLPAASFAGQQDTYLNITGKQAILQHISKCWASLFTGRAVIYRIQNGFDHRKVFISVIVQQMVFPQAAGVLFTADPVNGNRKVSSVDAVFGLGEALVSGIVNADNYKVCDESIIEKKIPEKKLAVYALAGGGVEKQAIEPLQQNMAVLADEQVLQLAHIGKKIELHFGQPQDIEWCLENDVLYIVQSRPITTLFPVPEAADEERHVYISVGHQQMMTDPLKPLGLSLWQLTASRPMFKAGGRLFVDVAQNLASAAGRDMLLQMMGQHDPLIKDALITIIERDYISIPLKNNDTQIGVAINKSNNLPGEIPVDNDPAIIAGLIKRSEEAVNAIKQHLQTKSGLDVFDCITEDMEQRKKLLADPLNMGVIMAAINASIWLNKKMEEWLEEKNVSDALTQSAPGNITSRMGLDLMDLADVIRPYPAVIEYLQQTNADNFLDELEKLDGGQQTRDAIVAYLEKYGMRCAGEIDITN
ncbi:MAG TPA: phosphoenolpyruvate synthase, partial [Chitinophagaceae bacterium]|nr:phosphoenolpyruvate synthase [Chitinophagaceae bacterium]